MLPNYLLDDFVPSPDAQAASDPGSQASASHHLPAGPAPSSSSMAVMDQQRTGSPEMPVMPPLARLVFCPAERRS